MTKAVTTNIEQVLRRVVDDSDPDRECTLDGAGGIAESPRAGWGSRREVVDVERRDPEAGQARHEPVVEGRKATAAVQNDDSSA